MATSSAIKFGQCSLGILCRVEGWGTMRESPAVHEFVVHTLNNSARMLVLDLSACDYLDSTFLGCLVDLHKRFNVKQPPRFMITNPSPACLEVLATNRLDRYLPITSRQPEPVGECVAIPPAALESRQLAEHVMECHRLLAEMGGRHAAQFAAIADQMARELAGKPHEP